MIEDFLPFRDECNCPCHGAVKHLMPCCKERAVAVSNNSSQPPIHIHALTEADLLAHELALENCVATIESYARDILDTGEGKDWLDISSAAKEFESDDPLKAELRYLELRGLLVRHPSRPDWIQILEPDHDAA